MYSSKASLLTSARRRSWEAAISSTAARVVELTRTVTLGVRDSSSVTDGQPRAVPGSLRDLSCSLVGQPGAVGKPDALSPDVDVRFDKSRRDLPAGHGFFLR